MYKDSPHRNNFKLKRKNLNHEKICDIAESVLVNDNSYQNVSNMFGVKKETIGRIMCKINKNPDYLDEVLANEEERNNKVQLTVNTATSMMNSNQIISNST